MKSGIIKKFMLAVMLLSLLSQVQADREINTFFSEILSLEARLGTLNEYTHLTDENLKLLQQVDELILENPSLLNESPTYQINHSLSGTKISGLKEAGKGFLDVSLARGGQVALVSFSDSARIDSYLSKNKYALHAKIDLYQPQGRTCLHCGILTGMEALSSTQLLDMVLISDGHSSLSNLPIQAAYSAAAKGIKIHTIALGDRADELLLENISEITGGNFYKIRCKKGLKEIYRELALEIGSGVLVSDISDSMGENFSLKCLEEGEICNARCLMNNIISLLEPLYITLILLTGFYLIFLSGSPEGRIQAKSALGWLILSMCIITLSPFILTLLFDISHSLAQGILAQAPENSGQLFSELINYFLARGAESASLVEEHSFPFIASPYFLLEAIFLMLHLRYFLVLTLGILLPLTILLYPFHPTRRIGRLLLEQTLIWTFSQAGIALVFVAVSLGINLIPNLSIVIPLGLKIIMELAALLLIIITPFWMAIKLRGFLP